MLTSSTRKSNPVINALVLPHRPAWVEIDVARWRRNLTLIRRELSHGTGWIAVIKDEAYGHGAVLAVQLVREAGAVMLAVANLEEALQLRAAGVTGRILLLGERSPEELPACVAHDLTCCVGDLALLPELAKQARKVGRNVPVHLKFNTGMNRYGLPWREAAQAKALIEGLAGRPLRVAGVCSHFATAEEKDKGFARLQLRRFQESLRPWQNGAVPLRHLSNSAGFLDLPEAHFDTVRLGLLPLGVYPSPTCRRLPGIEPVMSVKAKIAAVHQIRAGESVGYGRRYAAPGRRKIAVLPLGYGDGFPCVHNAGSVLLHGRRVPIVGSVAMDTITIDVTGVPEAQSGDTAVLMGRDQAEEISAHDLARLKRSVSYDTLCGWRARLPRALLNSSGHAMPPAECARPHAEQ